jgi:hypothetical protein
MGSQVKTSDSVTIWDYSEAERSKLGLDCARICCWCPSIVLKVTHPQLFDELSYESKEKDNERRRNWHALLGS